MLSILRAARPATSRLAPTLPLCGCSVLARPSLAAASPLRVASALSPRLSRSYASKKSKKGAAAVQEDEADEVEVEGKGKKGKGKGKGKEAEVVVSAGGGEGVFDLEKLEESMVDAVGKLRVNLKTVVGRVGRVTPALLDNIRVESEGSKRPLAEFAAVSVKDGKDLLVSVYEEGFMKAVSQALYDSPLGLAPQAASATSFRVPVPKPDWDKRQLLVKQAQDMCENARVAVRAVRGKGQKDIKSDVDAKVVNKEEGRGDTKKLDASTKKRTDEVDAIFEQAKRVLMDE
ncbi:hypothetical protein RQP46_011422 [Phenoliferia psychrophenolica]